MDGEELILGLLVFGPALIGLASAIVGIWLIASYRGRDPGAGPPDGGGQVWKIVLGVTCLIAALGIGGCYGLMFLGGVH